MAICPYCRQRAGWFREVHETCLQKAKQGSDSLKSCVADAILQGKKYADIVDRLKEIAADSVVP